MNIKKTRNASHSRDLNIRRNTKIGRNTRKRGDANNSRISATTETPITT
jgi:hypothetical protein